MKPPGRIIMAKADGLAILAIVVIASVIRLGFATSAPPFLNADSSTYYLPARDLLSGRPLDLGLQRTPTYPLFIAAVIATVGEDLQRLVTIQHFVFGPATAVLTYVLGRLLTGRMVALGAALLTAVSGPMLLNEHYVMTEAPLALLLLGTLTAVILAMRRGSWTWATVAGLLFGAAVLCRPSSQVIAPLLVGALLLDRRRLRQRAAAAALFGLSTSAVVVPWMAYNYSLHGSFAVASSGRFLHARLFKEEPGVFRLERPPGVTEDPTRAAARQIVQHESARTPPTSGSQRLRDELGLSLGEAHGILFELSMEAIRGRPLQYLQGTSRFFLEVFLGSPINVGREGLDWQQVDWGRAGRAVLQKPIFPLDAPRAEALLSLYDPARYGPLLPILFTTGLVLAGMAKAPRLMLLPGLASVLLVAVSAALGGHEVRHRYPQDPLITLVALQGLATSITLLTGRFRAAPRVAPATLGPYRDPA